jgi:succinyl-CoA synthetase beta subunit
MGDPAGMKIHEYQAKKILARHGVAVSRGEMASTVEVATAVASRLFAQGVSGVVVKAQIHAGGRRVKTRGSSALLWWHSGDRLRSLSLG